MNQTDYNGDKNENIYMSMEEFVHSFQENMVHLFWVDDVRISTDRTEVRGTLNAFDIEFRKQVTMEFVLPTYGKAEKVLDEFYEGMGKMLHMRTDYRCVEGRMFLGSFDFKDGTVCKVHCPLMVSSDDLEWLSDYDWFWYFLYEMKYQIEETEF